MSAQASPSQQTITVDRGPYQLVIKKSDGLLQSYSVQRVRGGPLGLFAKPYTDYFPKEDSEEMHKLIESKINNGSS